MSRSAVRVFVDGQQWYPDSDVVVVYKIGPSALLAFNGHISEIVMSQSQDTYHLLPSLLPSCVLLSFSAKLPALGSVANQKMSHDRDKPMKATDHHRKNKGYVDRSKRSMDGPGIWVSCIKGKERLTVNEIIAAFEELADNLWSKDDVSLDIDMSDDDDDSQDVEMQIAKELASMKKKPKRAAKRFASLDTNTSCVVFISCRDPVEPVSLVTSFVRQVQKTGLSRTKYTQRLTPISDTCDANIADISVLCKRIIESFVKKEHQSHSYKIELRIRNHSTLTKQMIFDEITKYIPETWVVKLDHPEVFILVEVFKATFGIGIVKDYYQLLKFNIAAITDVKAMEKHFSSHESTDRLARVSVA